MVSEHNRTRKNIKKPGDIPRREFLKVAAGSAAAVVSLSTKGKPALGATISGEYREEIGTPIVARYQVVVAGGGPSGVIAALAAARSGAKTLLIERYGFLGGNAIAGLMTRYNGFRNKRSPQDLQTVKGIPAEYIAEIVHLGGIAEKSSDVEFDHDITKGDLSYSVGFDPEVAKVANLNMIMKEGVNLRLHRWIAGPMVDGHRVTGVVVESKSGRQGIAADIVIDATGDADVAAGAGAEHMLPKPGNPRRGDHLDLTLMYQIGGLGSKKDSTNEIRIGDRAVRWGPYIDGNALDVEDLTRMEVATRLKLWDQIQALRKKPGYESVYLMQTATAIGVRETRRIIGEHIITEKDAIAGTRYPDVVAIISNQISRYAKQGGGHYFYKHEGFDVPYRALIPKRVEGLIVAGRCISCEQPPSQSARAMAGTMAIGQAAGCAAALAARGAIPPRELNVDELQKLLLSQNAELRI